MKSVLLSIVAFCAINSHAQLAINELCTGQTMDGVMVDFEQFNDTIYGTGFFAQTCGNAANHVAKWNGSEWETAGFEFPHDGNSLRTIGNELYGVTYVDSPTDSNWLYRYDGTNLTTVGDGVYLTTATNFSNLGNIYDVIEYNGEIYICGEFDRVGTQQISGIARWDGQNWSAVGAGLSGNIMNSAPLMFPHQMTVFNGELYVVGNYRFADGIEVNGIARWNGSNWSAVGDGFNGTVYGVGSFNNELYVGGSFTESNGVMFNRIAKWNGTSWVSAGFGFTDANPFFIFIHTFYQANNGLYIGGGLKEVAIDNGPSMACGGVVYYDGTSIETFSGGVTGNDIEAIIEDDNNQLLVGGGVFGSGYVGIVQDVNSVGSVQNASIQVIPNPVSDEFIITSELPFEYLEILDLSGRIVFRTNKDNEIDASDWDSGAYWVRSSINGTSYTEKFIKL